MVKEVRQALKEIKQYQHDNGIFCTISKKESQGAFHFAPFYLPQFTAYVLCENVKEVAQYINRIDRMIERKRVLLSD